MVIGGRELSVTYNPTSVVLQLVKAGVNLNVTSSINPSVYGQDAAPDFFTVTVTPLFGQGNIPPTDTVTFHFYNQALGVDTSLTKTLTNNQASFDPQIQLSSTLPVGTYTLDVTFSGDSSFNPVVTPVSLTQTVNKNPTNIPTPVLSVPSPIFGHVFTVTATMTPNTTPTAPNFAYPGGAATFTLDGSVLSPAVPLNNLGQAVLPLNNVPGSSLAPGRSSFIGQLRGR